MKPSNAKQAVEHPYSTADPDRPWNRRHLPSLYSLYEPTPYEIREAMQDLLGEILTEREQEVVRLLVDEGLSLQATADALGLRAKSHIFRTRERAFQKVREAIGKHPKLKGFYGYYYDD
jgi:DNA-directed RNA polymerase specialized sigma24 family protein